MKCVRVCVCEGDFGFVRLQHLHRPFSSGADQAARERLHQEKDYLHQEDFFIVQIIISTVCTLLSQKQPDV